MLSVCNGAFFDMFTAYVSGHFHLSLSTISLLLFAQVASGANLLVLCLAPLFRFYPPPATFLPCQTGDGMRVRALE